MYLNQVHVQNDDIAIMQTEHNINKTLNKTKHKKTYIKTFPSFPSSNPKKKHFASCSLITSTSVHHGDVVEPALQ